MTDPMWRHEILSHIDPELVEQAAETGRPRLPRRVRTALIAACVCIAVAGTVFAAEMLGGVFSGGPGAFEMNSVTYEGTRIITSDIASFSKDQFHAEFWTKAMERRARNLETGETCPLEYLSWKKAAEEMGVSLAESSYLNKNGLNGSCSVYPFESMIRLRTVYRLSETNIEIWAMIRLESEQDISVGDFVFAVSDGEIIGVENLQMPDGSNALILETESGDGSCSYVGCFVKNGILYLIFSDDDSGDGEGGRALLEKILEAFE